MDESEDKSFNEYELLKWSIVLTGKATATEIEDNWTYSDMLRCMYFMEQQAVEVWLSIPPETDNTSNTLNL